jgi:hypothetical protein
MKTLLFLLFILSSPAVAQKMKLLSGSLKSLKGQKSYAIKFRYDSMLVGTDTPEKSYLTQKKTLWEMEEPGKGYNFVRMWFDDRLELYQPAFIQSFEKYSRIELGDENAGYTLIVKTTRTEGGWSAGIVNHPGEIDGELWIVESADKTNVIARIGFYKIIGKVFYGGDFEMTGRIQSAYSVAAKGLGTFIRRKTR